MPTPRGVDASGSLLSHLRSSLGDLRHVQRLPGLQRVDRLMLGAVILEHAADVLHAPDDRRGQRAQVARCTW